MPLTDHAKVQELLELPIEDLGEVSAGFLCDLDTRMKRGPYTLSDKQAKWLDDLWGRHGDEEDE